MDLQEVLPIWLPILILLCAVYLYKKSVACKGQKDHLPPGPPKLPIIGNLHQLGQVPHQSLWKLSKEYGPVMFLRLGGVPTLIVSSSDAAKQVLKVHDLDCCSRPALTGTGRLSYNFKDIGFSPFGDYWREMRKICVLELFSSSYEDLDDIFQKAIYQHLRGERSEQGQVDIIDVLLQIEREQGKSAEGQFTRQHIKAILMNIFFRGVDTASVTVTWTMSELMKDPRAMKKAQEEVRSLIGNKGKVSEADVEHLDYLKLVVKESMRLHPPGPLLIPRETISAFNINGYHIPPRTRLYVNTWAIGRDPCSWDDPEKFVPERFEGSPIDFKGQQNFEFLPFGGGRRGCPGMQMGLAMVDLALANLLYHFDWKLPNGMMEGDLSMEEIAGLTLMRKDPLNLVPLKYHAPA